MATTVGTVTIHDFVQKDKTRLVALQGANRDMVNRCALAITTQARQAIKAVLGPGQRLSHLTGKPKITVFYRMAGTDQRPVATIRPTRYWHFVEHPHMGGYTVTPRVKTGKKAVRTPEGPRAKTHPGPMNHPPQPITRTFNRAAAICEQTAAAALQASLDRRVK
jgi:hypothetical protein